MKIASKDRRGAAGDGPKEYRVAYTLQPERPKDGSRDGWGDPMADKAAAEAKAAAMTKTWAHPHWVEEVDK